MENNEISFTLSRGGDSDSRPAVYDTAALPLSYLGTLIDFSPNEGNNEAMGLYRTRWQRKEERRNVLKAFLYVGGAVLLITGTIVWGMPLLVKMAVFVRGITSSDKGITMDDTIPPGPPLLISQYVATSSPRLAIRGNAEPGATVYLTQNLDSLGGSVVSENGTFLFPEITLKDGNNSFIGVVIDGAGNKSRSSDALDVYYSSTKPKLDISTPGDKQSFSGQRSFEIKGSTSPDCRVKVNERVLIVDSKGSFFGLYYPVDGDNVLTFTATDRVGNQTRKEITVSFRP